MISYQFISELFTNILLRSNAVGGRFFMSSKTATEINADNVGQMLSEALCQVPQGVKYPLVIMLPPRARGQYLWKQADFCNYRITTFWLKQTYYGEGAQINPNTQTSLHTVSHDWEDMQRCAENFMRVLDRLQRISPSNSRLFRVAKEDALFTPVSFVGADRVSGMRLDFSLSMAINCELQDYNIEDLNSIQIPSPVGHPEHKL